MRYSRLCSRNYFDKAHINILFFLFPVKYWHSTYTEKIMQSQRPMKPYSLKANLSPLFTQFLRFCAKMTNQIAKEILKELSSC